MFTRGLYIERDGGLGPWGWEELRTSHESGERKRIE